MIGKVSATTIIITSTGMLTCSILILSPIIIAYECSVNHYDYCCWCHSCCFIHVSVSLSSCLLQVAMSLASSLGVAIMEQATACEQPMQS